MLTLFSRLGHTTEDHIVDRGGIEIRSRQERVDTHRAEVYGVGGCESALSASTRSADGVNDVSLSHHHSRKELD
jgi:hypothetical protein